MKEFCVYILSSILADLKAVAVACWRWAQMHRVTQQDGATFWLMTTGPVREFRCIPRMRHKELMTNVALLFVSTFSYQLSLFSDKKNEIREHRDTMKTWKWCSICYPDNCCKPPRSNNLGTLNYLHKFMLWILKKKLDYHLSDFR